MPTDVAQLAAPADGAAQQPTNPTLSWQPVGRADDYLVELATDDTFTSGVRRRLATTSSLTIEGLNRDSTYYWRVRGGNVAGFGPWSDGWRFATSDVRLVEGGLLTFENGAPVFVEVSGPGGADPCGPDAESMAGCAEAGGNRVWDSVNGTGDYLLGTPASIGPEERIGLFAPHDFEIRVTQQGSYAYHLFTTGNAIWTPIEVWDIGPTGPFNANDPSDDVQLIVNLFSDSQTPQGECTFGYGEGTLFGQSHSDRIYGYYPIPGTTYDDYATLMGPLVDANPNGCPIAPATAAAAAFIDVGRGRPIQRVVFVDNTGGAKEVTDLVGTVIRFYTTAFTMSAPVPAAPRDRSVSLPHTVTLWWNVPPGAVTYHVQVSTTPGFATLVAEDSTLTVPSFTARNFPTVGSYYWRVRAANEFGSLSAWSSVWAFTVGTSTAVEDPEAGIPETFTLQPNYPNPFNPTTTIRFGLPRASDVTVTLYNVLGQRVMTLVEGHYGPGWYTMPWNAQGVGSGAYLYQIEAGNYREARTMLLVR